MSDQSDRRKESRKLVMAFTPVYDLEKGYLLGYLHNLTSNGAQVNGERKLKVDAQMNLSIVLPDELAKATSTRLNISARVARCNTVPDSPNSFEIGFEFNKVGEDQIEIIEKILERYHFRHRMY